MGVIWTRGSFDRRLTAAIREIILREREQPTLPTWGLIRRHLERMAELCKDGRIPSRQERDTCVPGTIAMRELEPAPDVVTYELCQRLHALQYYFQESIHVSPASWLARVRNWLAGQPS